MIVVTIWCIGVSLLRGLFWPAVVLTQLPFCPVLWQTWTALAMCCPRTTWSWSCFFWGKSPAYFGSWGWPRIEVTGSIWHSLWVWLGYMGHTGCSTDARVGEYHWHLPSSSGQSAVVGHSINLEHHIQLQNINILSNKSLNHIMRHAIEIKFHPYNMNREDGFCLSKSWKLLSYSLKEHRKCPSQDSFCNSVLLSSLAMLHTVPVTLQVPLVHSCYFSPAFFRLSTSAKYGLLEPTQVTVGDSVAFQWPLPCLCMNQVFCA
jgi:hypothetical protein